MRKVILFLSFLLFTMLCACHTQPSYEDGLSEGYNEGYYIGYDDGFYDGTEYGESWGYGDGLRHSSEEIHDISNKLFYTLDKSIYEKYGISPEGAATIIESYLCCADCSEGEVFSAVYALDEYVRGVMDAKQTLTNITASDLR